MGAKGISRRKLAKGCGIGPGAVNSWFDRGAENISLQTLRKLSDCFGIGIGELVHGRRQRREMTFSGSAYTDAGLDRITQIPHGLDDMAIPAVAGTKWTAYAIREVIKNQTCIGKINTKTVRCEKSIKDGKVVQRRLNNYAGIYDRQTYLERVQICQRRESGASGKGWGIGERHRGKRGKAREGRADSHKGRRGNAHLGAEGAERPARDDYR